MEKEKKQDQQFIAAQYGAYKTSNYALATDEMIDGMDLFQTAAEKLDAVSVSFKKGNLFEYIEAAKFNSDAALHGSAIRAQVTAANGDPHGAADIILKKGEDILAEVQAKSSDSSTALANYLKEDKYNDMMKLVPSDKAENVQSIAEGLSERHASKGLASAEGHADTARNVTGELKYGEITSGGTSYKENIFATENPEVYATLQKVQSAASEVGAATAQAAVAGAVIGCAISLVKNGMAISNGEITFREAARQSGKDALKAGCKSGGVGATGALLRVGAKEIGLQALTKSNVATSVAAGAIESGVSIYKYIKGEISGEEAVQKIGQNGVSTMSSIYTGAVAGSVFGPVGAVVGSIAGYMIASNIYQTSMAILKNAQLAKEESARVIGLCEAACTAMRANREEFEVFIEQRLQERRQEFSNCFAIIDTCFEAESYEQASFALADFAMLFGKHILFTNFEDFDRFMLDDEGDTLVI